MEENKLLDVSKNVEDNANSVIKLLEEKVSTEVSVLDDIMKNIYADVIQKSNPTIELLEQYYTELTNAIYFVGERVEKIGVLEDMSKLTAKQKYNDIYLDVSDNAEKKMTVAAITAQAEAGSVYETTVNTVYSKAYKIFKFKIDAAQEMMKCLSKLISRRISEIDLSKVDKSDGRQILLEGTGN